MYSLLFQPEIKELIETRDFAILRDLLIEWDPADIAELIESLDENQKAILFRLLPNDIATDTFEHLDHDDQMSIIHGLGHEEVATILNDMSPDDRTELLEELPAPVVRSFFGIMSPEERKVAQILLGYPENSVGRLMTVDYLAIPEHFNIQATLDYIRKNGKDSEILNIIYVVDDKGRLLDDLRIREILLVPPDTKIVDLMDRQFIALKPDIDQEEALSMFKKYDRFALPVIDNFGMLIGIVTADDVLDVAEEEATEDMLKMSAVKNIDETYVDAPLAALVKKRAGWLTVLFIGELLTATAMAYFEHEIARAVVLALFIPLIISSGGNTGSQATTLIIRALSLGELSLRDWWFVMKREFLSGLWLGAILGLLGFARVGVWQMINNSFGEHWLLIALTLCTSLVGVVLWGTLVGSMLPIILKKLKFDPAVSSAPFVATLVDVTGIVIYFTVATLILTGTIL